MALQRWWPERRNLGVERPLHLGFRARPCTSPAAALYHQRTETGLAKSSLPAPEKPGKRFATMTTLTAEAPQSVTDRPGLRERSAIKAIRPTCLDCMGVIPNQVKRCFFDGVHSKACPLWPFQIGCSPPMAQKRYGRDLLIPSRMPDPGALIEELA